LKIITDRRNVSSVEFFFAEILLVVIENELAGRVPKASEASRLRDRPEAAGASITVAVSDSRIATLDTNSKQHRFNKYA
jgi:hypothetical protein